MANVDAPFGLRPVMMLDGSPYNGQTIRCQFRAADATATFIGDLVSLDGTAGTEPVPTVKQGAAADVDKFFGVVVAFEFDATDLESKYRLASTQRACYVVPCSDALFEIQDDASAALTLDAVGETVDIAVGAGNITTGLSGMELAANNVGTGLNLLILGLVNREGNEAGNNANWLVRVNESVFHGGTDIGV